MTAPSDEMTCQEIVELVTEYFENTLPPDVRARFEAHLAECPYCRTYIDQMRQTLETLHTLDERSLSPQARDHLLMAFRGWKARR